MPAFDFISGSRVDAGLFMVGRGMVAMKSARSLDQEGVPFGHYRHIKGQVSLAP